MDDVLEKRRALNIPRAAIDTYASNNGRAGASRDLRMIGTGGREAFIERACVETMPLVRQHISKRAPDDHDARASTIYRPIARRVDLAKSRNVHTALTNHRQA